MRLEIFSEPNETEPIVRLKLVKEGGSINLTACDENGKAISCGNIVVITGEGALLRCFSVSKKLGLQLGSDGRIVLA